MLGYFEVIPIGPGAARVFFDPSKPAEVKSAEREITAVILSVSPGVVVVDGQLVVAPTGEPK